MAEKKVPHKIMASISELVKYNWENELEDYIDNRNECGASHIFRHLVAVDGFIEGYDKTANEVADEYLKENRR